MKITKESDLTGVVHTKNIDVTEEQLANWQDGMLIQKAMPNLEPWEREFILSGITKEEWEEHFKEVD